MPFYTVITEDDFLSDQQRDAIAQQICEIHCEVNQVPPAFVRTFFITFPKGSGFTAGKPAAPAAITCLMRTGHDTETKGRLLKRLWAMFQDATGVPTDQLVVVLQEVSGSNAMEMGAIMPDPGNDGALWPRKGIDRRGRGGCRALVAIT